MRITAEGKVVQGHDDDFNRDYWEFQGNATEGRLKCEAPCDPSHPTYVTVCFRGGGAVPGIPYICDGSGAGVGWPRDFDEPTLWGRAPDRFFYATCQLPEELTKGKRRTTFYIGVNGLPARRVYAVHVHRDALLVLSSDGLMVKSSSLSSRPSDHPTIRPSNQHQHPAQPYSWPRFKPLPKELSALAKKRTLELMTEMGDRCAADQYWCPDWREKVARGELPAELVGGFMVRERRGPDGRVDVSATKDETTRFYDSHNNQGPLLDAAVMAYAYATPGCRQHGDRAWLERIALGLDFARRMQGSSGAYFNAWAKGRWPGGPNRAWASGSPLEGHGQRGTAHALVLTVKAMEKEGLLDELVDDDANPETPPIPRRQCYIDLARASAWFFARTGGHAPNQETYQLDALALFLKALDLLGVDPKDNLPLRDDGYEMRFRRCVGSGALAPGEWAYVGPKGISLEHGGYTSEYGSDQAMQYYRLYRYTGFGFCRDAAKVAGFGFSSFLYPVYEADGQPHWALCGFLNTRHRKAGGDGWPTSAEHALYLRNPRHIRILQMENRDLTADAIARWGRPNGGNWFFASAYGFMRHAWQRWKVIDELTRPDSPLCADVHLPLEHGQPPFVFSDEAAEVVSFKDGDDIFMLTFKGVFLCEVRSPKGDRYLRLPEVKPENGVKSITLGNYWIAMNTDAHERRVVTVPLFFGGKAKYTDLATGKPTGRTFSLKPYTTCVVRVEKLKS